MTVLKKTYKARRNFTVPCLFLSLALCGASMSARAQQDMTTVNRLNRIENEIETLSRAIFKGEQPPPGAFDNGNATKQADIEVRLNQIEAEIQDLTGKVEQQGYDLRTLQEKTSGVESLAPAASPTTITSPVSANTPPQPDAPKNPGSPAIAAPLTADDQAIPSGDEQKLGSLSANADGNDPVALYEQAYANMKDKKYDEAEKGFTAFLDRYSDHSLGDNARYWLGETYYVRGQFDKASRQFAQAYQKNPMGSKGPDNLLKLALSLSGSGKKDDACLALEQLKSEYGTKSNAPVLARAAKEAKNMGCKQ